MSKVEKGRIGSSFDDFLDEEGIREEVEAQALKDVLAWQIEQEMKAARLTKTAVVPGTEDRVAKTAGGITRPREAFGGVRHVLRRKYDCKIHFSLGNFRKWISYCKETISSTARNLHIGLAQWREFSRYFI